MNNVDTNTFIFHKLDYMYYNVKIFFRMYDSMFLLFTVAFSVRFWLT